MGTEMAVGVYECAFPYSLHTEAVVKRGCLATKSYQLLISTTGVGVQHEPQPITPVFFQ